MVRVKVLTTTQGYVRVCVRETESETKRETEEELEKSFQ